MISGERPGPEGPLLRESVQRPEGRCSPFAGFYGLCNPGLRIQTWGTQTSMWADLRCRRTRHNRLPATRSPALAESLERVGGRDAGDVLHALVAELARHAQAERAAEGHGKIAVVHPQVRKSGDAGHRPCRCFPTSRVDGEVDDDSAPAAGPRTAFSTSTEAFRSTRRYTTSPLRTPLR